MDMAVLKNAMECNSTIAGIITQTNAREMIIDSIIAKRYCETEEQQLKFRYEILCKEFFLLSKKIEILKNIFKEIDEEKYEAMKKERHIDKLRLLLETRNKVAHGNIIHSQQNNPRLYFNKELLSIEELHDNFWNEIIPSVNDVLSYVGKYYKVTL